MPNELESKGYVEVKPDVPPAAAHNSAIINKPKAIELLNGAINSGGIRFYSKYETSDQYYIVTNYGRVNIFRKGKEDGPVATVQMPFQNDDEEITHLIPNSESTDGFVIILDRKMFAEEINCGV